MTVALARLITRPSVISPNRKGDGDEEMVDDSRDDRRVGGSHVGYATAVHTQGRGDPLRLRGDAFLEIVALSGTNDINTGESTYNPRNLNELVNVRGWRTFRQAASGGSFEGYTTIGLGVRARLPFRVFTLDRPSRIVIDVAHHW